MLIPCIDLQDGQAVQLVHGRRLELSVKDVFGLLDKFQQYKWLHIIDLDAAMGKARNDKLARQLCRTARRHYKMKVRIGGGIRTVTRAAEVARWGSEQIIIGSAVFRGGRLQTLFLRRVSKFLPPRRLIIALDTAKNHVTVNGWRRRLKFRPQDVMAQLEIYCSGFLCTDVDREGTMAGANLDWFRKLRSATSHPIIAAGGIKSLREIHALEKIGIDAAVGMALYKNRLR